MSKKALLSVTIPCFNEADNLPQLFFNLKNLITENKLNKKDKKDIEIIIVNNGSTDNTKNILSSLNKYDFIKVIHIKKNKGYGFGIFKGLKKSNSEYCGWTHADLQTDINDILKALQIIKSYNSNERVFIKGIRVGRGLYERFFSRSMSLLLSIIFFRPLSEINAQPNIFHSSLLKNMINPPNDFSFDLYAYILALKNNYSFLRFKVRFFDRKYGSSKWNLGFTSQLKFIWRTINYSIKMRLNNIK